jgi:hypothetical protein
VGSTSDNHLNSKYGPWLFKDDAIDAACSTRQRDGKYSYIKNCGLET